MLMGGYVCTSKPGEFRWAPGPLAKALAAGVWLVVENVNLASSEVLTLLLSVCRTKTLNISSRAETITAKPGFQLIMTSTTIHAGKLAANPAVKKLAPVCNYIRLEELKETEKMTIISNLYPSLSFFVSHLSTAIDIIQGAVSFGSPNSRNQLVEGALETLTSYGLERLGRIISFRDMMKWAQRMTSVHSKELSKMSSMDASSLKRDITLIPISIRESALFEFADCIILSISSLETKRIILKSISNLWGLPESTVESYLCLRKPAVYFGRDYVEIGRAHLPLRSNTITRQVSYRLFSYLKSLVNSTMHHVMQVEMSRSFAQTGSSVRLMERLAIAISQDEPILLVGETGTGKTTVIQEMAKIMDRKMVAVNLSQQTDSSDLLGGFRPVQPGNDVIDLLSEFTYLVQKTWNRGNNEEYLSRITKLAQKCKYKQLSKAMNAAVGKWRKLSDAIPEPSAISSKGLKRHREELKPFKLDQKWSDFAQKLETADRITSVAEQGFAFGFSEGVLVRAFKEGWWLLLDEINLAPAEVSKYKTYIYIFIHGSFDQLRSLCFQVLERIAGILESHQEGLLLSERGDEERICRHSDFRVFAAMNPATDSGKKELPALVRSRFTEFWIDEPSTSDDLTAIVSQHLGPIAKQLPVDKIIEFYLKCKILSVCVTISVELPIHAAFEHWQGQ